MKTRTWIVMVTWIVTLVWLGNESFAQVRTRLLENRFRAMDRDGDGKLTGGEMRSTIMLENFDRDGDSALSLAEFTDAAKAAADRRAGKAASQEWSPATFRQPPPPDAAVSEASILAAAKYSASNQGISFLVMHEGELLYEDYPNGGKPDRASELASGTKSFSGVLACAAVDDGLMTWDERISDTITSWKSDPAKASITVSQLLHLTGGLEASGRADRQVPSYAEAIANASSAQPGEQFQYGPVPFQCFGELMRLKLDVAGTDSDPLAYLDRRVFQPIGLEFARWRRDADGNPHLPSGAALTARQWAKFGELIRNEGSFVATDGGDPVQVVSAQELKKCFQGTQANPAYGITFWLNQPVPASQRRRIRQLQFGTDDMTQTDKIPSDMFFAAGAGRQRLFVIPSLKLTIVRQTDTVLESMQNGRDDFSDLEFISRLLR